MSDKEIIKSTTNRPPGYPRDLQHEIIAALYPIIKKYKKTYLSNDVIGGIMLDAVRDCNQILYKR